MDKNDNVVGTKKKPQYIPQYQGGLLIIQPHNGKIKQDSTGFEGVLSVWRF